MYILEPTLDEEATKALIGQIEEFMGKQGATFEATDPWGKRRLAYRIGKHHEGYYVLSRLQAEAESVSGAGAAPSSDRRRPSLPDGSGGQGSRKGGAASGEESGPGASETGAA